MLHTQRWGKGDPVVVLHGFTQSGASWLPMARRLSADHLVVAVDLPGHGASAGVAAGLWDGAALIGEAATAALDTAALDTAALDTVALPSAGDGTGTGDRPGDAGRRLGRAAYVGYSLGGRFALHLALLRPEIISRLVVVSASGGIDGEDQRAARRAADEDIARRVESDGVDAFVRWWLERPLFATLAPAAAAVDSRLGGSAAGLASSLRLAGAGRQQPLWSRLGALTMPVLVVAGALDEAYAARAHRLATAIGANARVAIIDGAGHACHLEAPERWWAAVGPFLADSAGHGS